MRRSTLLLLVPLLGCAAEQDEAYAVVEDFLDRTMPAECTRVIPEDSMAVTALRTATDSTWLILDEARRRIVEVDDRLRTLWSLDYPATGPGSLAAPVGIAPLGDSALAVADRGTLRLVVLDRTGEQLRSTPIDFLPNGIAATPAGDILVTPIPMQGRPGTLLVRYEEGASKAVELAVPARYYEDPLIRAVGNATVVETLPDGTALVLHEFMAPRGFAVEPDGRVTPLRVPTPDATLSQVDFVPTMPLTEEQQPLILLPAIALSVDGARSEVYLMTRSGRTVGDVPQRAILRLDERLGFMEAFTVDVAAGRMAVLARRRAALLVDDEDRLHRCTLPLGEAPRAVAE